MKHEPYAYAKESDFLKDLSRLKGGLPFLDDRAVLNSTFEIDGKIIRNRLLAQPIEGGDALESGAPSGRTIRRYCDLAAGGSGVIWMESISVNQEGKSVPRQMWLRRETAEEFSKMVTKIHETKKDTIVVAQLTHSGRNSNPDGKKLAVCAFENPCLPQDNFRIVKDEELDMLREDYISAAILAQQAGFDAVDIRACHGYLLNELFAAYKRGGKYGGSFENRTRLLRDIIRGVKAKTDLTVAVRLNVTDGLPYPFGWGCEKKDVWVQDMTEPLKLVQELEHLGVSVINVSAGIGACTPYMIRPFDRGNNLPDEHPLEGVERLLQSAKKIKETVPSVCVVASGLTWLRDFAPAVAAGGIAEGWFDLAGFGRQWIADPAYANEILQGIPLKKKCTTCGGCMGILKKGQPMRCVNNRGGQGCEI